MKDAIQVLGTRICIVISLVLIPCGFAQADTLFGIYAGAGTWEQEYSGQLDATLTTVDIEKDLGLQDDSNNVFYFALEHGVPFLPNLRAQYFNIDVSGDSVLSRAIEFNGQVFALSDAVASTVELSQTDAVLYYEVLDNVVSLDLGLAISKLEGRLAVVGSTQRAEADFDEIFPMLYGRVRADLPLTGLWFGAEAQGLSYAGNTLAEYNAQLGWSSEMGLGVEVGYRAVSMELEAFESVQAADLDIKGPYAAVNFHF